jgi:nitroreductase
MIVDTLDRTEYRKFLKSTVLKAQKCQRNWDLSKKIPKEDLDVIVYAATQAPSKQNLDFYSLLVIQNREIQEKIYENTWTIPNSPIGRLNPQVLANVLLVFVSKKHSTNRNEDTRKQNLLQIEIDRNQAVGVSAGFVNVVAQSLGYSTGCNKCCDKAKVKEILNIDQDPILMMGVGFKNESRNRREEHFEGFMVESRSKLPISIEYID